MRTKTFLLKRLLAKRLSILTVVVVLLLSGCSANPGPGGGATKVSFYTEDGVSLSGYIFGSGDVGIILSHMRLGDQANWWPFARVLKGKGYQVLAYDFRGYRDSEGDVDVGSIDIDLEAALAFLRDEGVSKVFLIGASMGGTASLKVASREDVAGVVTISAPPAIEGLNAVEDVPRILIPKLLIAAKDDLFHARSVNLFDQIASNPKEIHVLDGNNHGTAMLSGESGARTQGLIVDFLRRYAK